jgi:hypothetical protein
LARERQDANGRDGEMKTWGGKVKGVEVYITRAQVMESLRLIKPRKVQKLAVEVGGVWFPLKQALAHVLGRPRDKMDAKQCKRVFRTLGFRISTTEHPLIDQDLQGRPLLKPRPEAIDRIPAEHEWLDIGRIHLSWSWWEWWMEICGGFLGGAQVEVPRESGVYEVKVHGEETLLYIGKAVTLQMRVIHQLVRGTGLHAAGRKIEQNEDVGRVCVRWAITDRPAAAEEELVRAHVEAFGAPPKYTVHS